MNTTLGWPSSSATRVHLSTAMRVLLTLLLLLISAPLFAGSYADLILSDAPSAYWRLDETSGTTAFDHAGGAHGLYTGGVTPGVPGPPAFGSESRAALFNGSSGNVDTPFGFNPAGGSFTLEAWVRLDAFNGSSTSAILQQDGPLGRTLLKVEGGLREFSSHLGNDARLSGFPVSTGTWHHLALVYDDAVNQIRWYVDGAAYAVETVVPEPETAPLLIARHKSLSGLHFNGAIAEVAVYPAALSAERIALRAAFVPPTEPPDPPPPAFPEVALHVNPAHPQASDSEEGTESAPLRTLTEAAARSAPGTTVWVHPGIYTESLVLSRSGTAAQPIIFRSTERGAARLAPIGTALSPDPDEPATHVVIDGFDITDADPDSFAPAVRAGSHWTIRHCRIHDAFEGILLDTTFAPADHVSIAHTVIEDCRANALAARGDLPLNQRGPHHLLVERSLLRRCNLDAHGEASTGGAAHFSGTNGVTLREVISYDNNGPSFRFTWQDTGFLIEDCTVFGNHGSEAWVGAGIWIEMSPGPGVIVGNTVFSNTGAGIALLEAGNLTLEDNLLIDNEAALVLRDDYHPWVGSASGVTRYLRDLRIAANRFHAWRRAALTTWTEDEQTPQAGSPRWIDIDENAYDPGASSVLVDWFSGPTLTSLAEVRAQLGFENSGSKEAIALPPGFTPFATTPGTTPQLDPMDGHTSLAGALATAESGAALVVPVHAARVLSHDENSWHVELHDLAAYTFVEARGTDPEVFADLTSALTAFPRWQPLYLLGEYDPSSTGEGDLHLAADERTLLAERHVDLIPGTVTAAQLGPDPAILTLRRQGLLQEAFTVEVETGGSALAGTDYAAVPADIHFAPGVAEVTIAIVPLERDDFPPEAPALFLRLPIRPDFVSARDTTHVDIRETPYRQWLRQHFSLAQLNDPEAPIAPGADASGDGNANLLAFAFAQDPALPLDPTHLPRLLQDGDGQTFLYPMRAQASGIRYLPETSMDLVTWHPLETLATPTHYATAHPEILEVVFTLPPPLPQAPRFFRLRVFTSAPIAPQSRKKNGPLRPLRQRPRRHGRDVTARTSPRRSRYARTPRSRGRPCVPTPGARPACSKAMESGRMPLLLCKGHDPEESCPLLLKIHLIQTNLSACGDAR